MPDAEIVICGPPDAETLPERLARCVWSTWSPGSPLLFFGGVLAYSVVT